MDCIIWNGTLTPKGYGWVYVPAKKRQVLAHRWAWEQANGPIPPRMVIMHTCDNPPCINLDHLRMATQADNLADMRAKGRERRFVDYQHSCRKGHPFTDENTLWGTRDGYQTRCCRTCARERMRRYRWETAAL